MTSPMLGFEAMIGRALKYGVYISSAVIIRGITLAVASIGSSTGCPGSLEGIHEGGFGTPTLSLDIMFTGLTSMDPQSIIEMGVLLLLAIPFFRVIVGSVMYGIERNWLYVAISMLVLAALFFSAFVVAPLEAHG